MESPRISSITTSQETNNNSLKTKWLLCPKCTKNIPTIVSFINNGIASIVLECQCGNHQILSIEDYLNIPSPKTVHQCDFCNDKNDALYCLMCMKWLCPECITKHNMMEKNKEHNFIKSEVLMRSQCALHNKNFNVSYCYTCERGICSECLNEDHKSHESIKLSELYSNLSMAIDVEKINEGINMIMKQKEVTKTIYVKMIDGYIETLNQYKSEVEREYASNRNKNNQIAELINILFSNYDSTQLYPNYNIIRNLEINVNLNMKDFEPTDYQNFSLYTREIISYFKNFYIINFNISTMYEKVAKITEYWVNNLIAINSKTFASSSMKDIKIWNLSCKCIATLSGHTKPITTLIKLNNGNQLASASFDKSIKIWNIIPPYNCVASLDGNKREVTSMIQLKDNRLLSISEDGTCFTWDVTKKKILKIIYLEQSIHLLSEISNGYIAIDSRALIKLYNTNNFSKSKYLVGHSDDISSLLYLPNGKLLSGSKDKTIRVWDIKEQICEKVLKGSNGKIVNLAQLFDGSVISSCSDGSINMWDIEMGHKLNVLNSQSVSAIIFIQLNDNFIFSSSKESIDIWKIKTAKRIGLVENEFRLFY